MQWYYAKENKQIGQVDEIEFKRLIDTDQITPNDLVWNSTMKDWTPAASVAGLFPDDYVAPPTTPVTYSFEHTTTDFSKLTNNDELIQRAKTSLQNNWGPAAEIRGAAFWTLSRYSFSGIIILLIVYLLFIVY